MILFRWFQCFAAEITVCLSNISLDMVEICLWWQSSINCTIYTVVARLCLLTEVQTDTYRKREKCPSLVTEQSNWNLISLRDII
jgi:hypothetical protein